MKFLALLFFLLPSLLFSQFLEEEDIDIFAENIEEIGTLIFFASQSDSNNDEWTNYLELMSVPYSISYNSVESFNNYFQSLLTCTVPDELENLFGEIGWHKNGHQKFVVIIHGLTLLFTKTNMEKYEQNVSFPERYNLIIGILETFDAMDLQIIEINAEKISNLMSHK